MDNKCQGGSEDNVNSDGNVLPHMTTASPGPRHMSHESKNCRLVAGGAALLPTSKNCRTLPSVQCPHSTLAMVTPAAGDMELRLNKARQCQHQRTLLFQNLSRLTTSLYKLTVSKVYWKVGCEIINLNYRSVAVAQKQYLNDKGC